MKIRSILFIILASFLLSSCTSNVEKLEKLYEDQNYEALITEAQKSCQKELTDENLYYLMMGYYELKQYTEATELAYLYKSVFPEANNHHKSALIILMYNDDSVESYNAAEELIENYSNLTLIDYSIYFSLASKYAPSKAIEYYNMISPRLTNKEKLLLLSTGFAPIINVISALEAYYEETNGNEEYQQMLARVLETYSQAKLSEDSSILVSFAENTINANPLASIYLGDLYYKLGHKGAANKHWNAALEKYPAEVKSRLFKYQ